MFIEVLLHKNTERFQDCCSLSINERGVYVNVYMKICVYLSNLPFLYKFRKGTQRFLTAFAQAVYSKKKKVNKNAHYQGNRAVLNHKMYFLFFSATAYSITCRYSSLFSCWM